jgi:hypothetical protein
MAGVAEYPMSLGLISVLPLLSVDVPRTQQVVVSVREAQLATKDEVGA